MSDAQAETNAIPHSYPVGQAPWDKSSGATASAVPQSFPVGQAPWEQTSAPSEGLSGAGGNFDSNGNLVGAVRHGPATDARTVTDLLPAAGSVIGGYGGALAPVPGAAEVGAGAGASLGSVMKDNINNYFNGGTKSAGDIAKDAAIEGGTAAGTQLAGGLLLKGAGKALGSLAEQTVPRAVIDRFKTAADAVETLISDSQGHIAKAANLVKSSIQESLDNFRSAQYNEIKNALADNTERINPSGIITKLEQWKGRISGDIAPEAHTQLDEMIGRIKNMRDENGQVFAKDAFSLQQELQDKATAAYRAAGESGQGTQIENAYKEAAAITRSEVNPKIGKLAAANEKLAALHRLEDNMNVNIIKDYKSKPLIAAGEYAPGHTGGNADYALALENLGKITGEDYLGKAQDLAAMKSFSGSSLYRKGAGVALGAGVGAGATELAGDNPYEGAFVGGALGGAVTSPVAIKAGINLSRNITAPVISGGVQTLGQAVMHGTGAIDAIKRDQPK